MLQIERDFLNAIRRKDNTFLHLCLSKGLTANICDEKGNTALEYALKYENTIFVELAQHPKTSKGTLARALDYLEVQRYYNEDIIAYKKWKKETPLPIKIIDIVLGNKAFVLSSNSAAVFHSLCIKQHVLYQALQKERN